MQIKKIIEYKDAAKYLINRDLIKQYQKQKDLLLEGNLKQVDFKKRKPYSNETWYFRINKKFRAHGFFDGDTFKIFKIDDHQ